MAAPHSTAGGRAQARSRDRDIDTRAGRRPSPGIFVRSRRLQRACVFPDGYELEKLWSRLKEPAETRDLAEDLTQYRTTLEFKGNTFERRQWKFSCRWAGVVSTEGAYHLDVHR